MYLPSEEELALALKGVSDRSVHQFPTKEWWFEQANASRLIFMKNVEKKREDASPEIDAMEQTVALVEHTLGATVIETKEPTRPVDFLAPTLKEVEIISLGDVSKRALTTQAVPLTRAFLPSKVGFTAQMFKVSFPNLNPGDTLERFLSHHISKGDTSKNWFERFMSFAAEGERRAREAANNHETETNSLGFATNRDQRIHRRREEEAHAQEYWQIGEIEGK